MWGEKKPKHTFHFFLQIISYQLWDKSNCFLENNIKNKIFIGNIQVEHKESYRKYHSNCFKIHLSGAEQVSDIAST